MELTKIFEALMLLAFASSWPFSIIKTLRTKQVAGKSLLFILIVDIGYVAGILSKVTAPTLDWRIWLYVFNFAIVSTDLALYLIYRKR